jgi:chemotaxis protein CheC
LSESEERIEVDELELDRLQELANIGAGHAATAFATLAGRRIWMGVPRTCKLGGLPFAGAPTRVGTVGGHEWSTGVFFEFEGCVDALVGILFQASASEEVIRCIVGMDEGELPPHIIESALMEVGNILASHVASAIADTLGERLLPSIPTLAMNGAENELEALLSHRSGHHPIRIECELMDEEGGIGGLLVLIPRTSPQPRSH